jgi:hypothetical protein
MNDENHKAMKKWHGLCIVTTRDRTDVMISQHNGLHVLLTTVSRANRDMMFQLANFFILGSAPPRVMGENVCIA